MVHVQPRCSVVAPSVSCRNPAVGVSTGIEQSRTARDLGLDRMLLQPFRGEEGGDAIGRSKVR